MAQESKTQKQKWGMGSFLQQAVAGVESRLDHILMDEEGNQTSATAKPIENEIGEASPAKAPAACTSFMEKLAIR
jgi:hypothetical protein